MSIAKPDAHLDVSIELYDMGSMENALGIFGAQRDAPTKVAVEGSASCYLSSVGVIGIAGPYYFKVSANSGSAVVKQKTQQLIAIFEKMGGVHKFDPAYDKLLHRAYKIRINYIDTAQEYAGGQSQKTIAPFIKQVGNRKNIWITSKVHLDGNAGTPAAYKSGLDECLADLQTDYLDMFFMHMVKDENRLDPEYLKMGDNVKKSGKTRFFGLIIMWPSYCSARPKPAALTRSCLNIISGSTATPNSIGLLTPLIRPGSD